MELDLELEVKLVLEVEVELEVELLLNALESSQMLILVRVCTKSKPHRDLKS